MRIILSLAVLAVVYLVLSVALPFRQTEGVGAEIDRPFNAVQRMLAQPEELGSWWPGATSSDTIVEFYNKPVEVQYTAVNGLSATLGPRHYFVLSSEARGAEKSFLHARIDRKVEPNFLQRVPAYFTMLRNKYRLQEWVRQAKANLETDSLVYGVTVRRTLVSDTVVMTLRTAFKEEPDMSEVYNMVDSVRTYVQSVGGIQTNAPMLNILRPVGEGEFIVTVGVPVRTSLPETERIRLRRMVPGNLLEAQVKGGMKAITEAEKNLAYYVADTRNISPAIPYQLMVTNRRAEPDSSKWITRLYYPVIR